MEASKEMIELVIKDRLRQIASEASYAECRECIDKSVTLRIAYRLKEIERLFKDLEALENAK